MHPFTVILPISDQSFRSRFRTGGKTTINAPALLLSGNPTSQMALVFLHFFNFAFWSYVLEVNLFRVRVTAS